MTNQSIFKLSFVRNWVKIIFKTVNEWQKSNRYFKRKAQKIFGVRMNPSLQNSSVSVSSFVLNEEHYSSTTQKTERANHFSNGPIERAQRPPSKMLRGVDGNVQFAHVSIGWQFRRGKRTTNARKAFGVVCKFQAGDAATICVLRTLNVITDDEIANEENRVYCNRTKYQNYCQKKNIKNRFNIFLCKF